MLLLGVDRLRGSASTKLEPLRVQLCVKQKGDRGRAEPAPESGGGEAGGAPVLGDPVPGALQTLGGSTQTPGIFTYFLVSGALRPVVCKIIDRLALCASSRTPTRDLPQASAPLCVGAHACAFGALDVQLNVT